VSGALRIHPAFLSDSALLKECRVTFGRASGPGGQHRNKVETAVRIEHLPTGMSASAGERRTQRENHHAALRRLRLRLAMGVRRSADPRRYVPSALWSGRRQGDKMPINPRHRDYPALLAEALDVICAADHDVAAAAEALGVTMSQLARLLRHEKAALASVNEGRAARMLHPLR
jgi:hypothetical protein